MLNKIKSKISYKFAKAPRKPLTKVSRSVHHFFSTTPCPKVCNNLVRKTMFYILQQTFNTFWSDFKPPSDFLTLTYTASL